MTRLLSGKRLSTRTTGVMPKLLKFKVCQDSELLETFSPAF